MHPTVSILLPVSHGFPVGVEAGGHVLHGLHTAHEVGLSDLLTLPALHCEQSSILELPKLVEYVYGGQEVHVLEPALVTYVPG